MFIVIVGCGKVGVNTARSLLHMGHEVIVIEQRKSRYDLLVDELGSNLMLGDGTEIWVLEKAGIARADSGAKVDDKVLNMISGRKLARDRSTDSIRSSGSGSNKKVAFAEEGEKAPSPLHNAEPAPSATPALVDSMRNLGNSLNPMTRIAGMGMMRGFGRSAPTSPIPPPPAPSKGIPDGGVAELTTVRLLSTFYTLTMLI